MTLSEIIEDNEKETEQAALRYFAENGFGPESEREFAKKECVGKLGALFRVFIAMPANIILAFFCVVGVIVLIVEILDLIFMLIS